jgi:hypothetical protein
MERALSELLAEPATSAPRSLNIKEWRVCTKQEVVEFIDVDKKRPKGSRDFIIVRSLLRPVDVYCYLVARFGRPNGFQNFLRKDDSDNWIHWDFNLKSDDVDVYFAGTSREIHIIIGEKLTDQNWKELILAIKSDSRRLSKEKAKIQRSLEKFVVFQNKYVSLAGLCADLHASIIDAPPREKFPKNAEAYAPNSDSYSEALKRISDRANKIYGDCLKLRLITPIMAEAFINMLILMFCKDAIRDDAGTYGNFLRANIPERLALLNQNCVGFNRAIDKTTDAYANFMRVVSKRNFALHGNVDPMKEQIEVVYFDGRRPLFVNPGHNIEKLFEHLEAINKPLEAVQEYENVHAFLAEVADCLEPRTRSFFRQVIEDAYPGYEVRKRRPTRILPDVTVVGFSENMRFDDDLQID